MAGLTAAVRSVHEVVFVEAFRTADTELRTVRRLILDGNLNAARPEHFSMAPCVAPWISRKGL